MENREKSLLNNSLGRNSLKIIILINLTHFLVTLLYRKKLHNGIVYEGISTARSFTADNRYSNIDIKP